MGRLHCMSRFLNKVAHPAPGAATRGLRRSCGLKRSGRPGAAVSRDGGNLVEKAGRPRPAATTWTRTVRAGARRRLAGLGTGYDVLRRRADRGRSCCRAVSPRVLAPGTKRSHPAPVRVAAPNAGGRPGQRAGIAARARGTQALRAEAFELLVEGFAHQCVTGHRSTRTCDARAHVAELLALHHGVLRITDVHAGGSVHARRTQTAVLAGAFVHHTRIVRIGAAARAPGHAPQRRPAPSGEIGTAQADSCGVFLDTARTAGDTRGAPKEGPTT
jgi:hypothetical protein